MKISPRDKKTNTQEHEVQCLKPSQANSHATRKILPIVITAILALAVYANAITGDFVYDDELQVLKNTWITDIRNTPDIFTSNVWAFDEQLAISNYYRPLMHMAYMANYYTFGFQPWGFHLVNILLHCAVSILVYLLIRRLMENHTSTRNQHKTTIPLLAAAMFAVHPIHTEAVTWIAGLPELAFTFFYLSSLHLYLKSKKKASPAYILSLVCFATAILFKEPAATLPLILIAYDCAFPDQKKRLPHYIKRYLPYAAITAAYIALRMNALHGFVPLKRHASLDAYQYALNVLSLFTQYIGKLIVPINLNAFYVFHPINSIMQAKGIAALAVTILYAIALTSAYRKDRTAFTALALIAVPLLPVLYIPALGENTFADRYLYLPSVGYALLIALILRYAHTMLPRIAKPLTMLVLATCTIYAAATITRNSIWKDNESLWSDTLQKSPDSARAQLNMAVILLKREQTDAAMDHLQEALRLDNEYADASYNLALAYAKKNDYQNAIQAYLRAIQLKPNNAYAHYGLATAYGNNGQMDKAIEHFNEALRQKPNYAEARYNLGIAYDAQKQPEMAISQYEDAVRLRPTYIEAHNTLAIAYAATGRKDKAIAEFETLTRLKPKDPDAHYNLALAYLSAGKQTEATIQLQEVLRLRPNDTEAARRLNQTVLR